jgi:hypothetical protein
MPPKRKPARGEKDADDVLPSQLLAIRNADKKCHETWDTAGDLLNFPHPFRGVLLGPPNCGKTTTVKNILMRQEPPFKRFYVIHCDGEYTAEYNDVEGKLLKDFPEPNQWPGKEKTLVVVDDVELKTLKQKQRMCLDRLFGYVSTHKNISVLLCSQDPFNVPAIVRRCSNIWVLWPGRDVDSVQTCARKCGEDLREKFKLCKTSKDSVWIDLTDNSPLKVRLNGYVPLTTQEVSLPHTS